MKKCFLFLLFSILLFSCKENNDLIQQPQLEEIENKVRSLYDNNAVFTYEQYEILLQALKNKGCVVKPLYQFPGYNDSSTILVGLRHDIDCHPFKAIELARIEKQYDFRATYYILPTARYYGSRDKNGTFYHYTCMNQIYQQIQGMGHEIGNHNDLLTVMIDWQTDPFVFNELDLKYLKNNDIKIYGTASHGAPLCRITNTLNYEIFKDFAKKPKVHYANKEYKLGIDSLRKFGYQYEAYHLNNNVYISDTGGEWHISRKNSKNEELDISEKSVNTFEEVLQTIETLQPGDVLIILTHPVWWGKK